MQIHDLITDIYSWLGKASDKDMNELKRRTGERVVKQFPPSDEAPPRRGLRLSQMGPRCPCELWHMVNKPELAQPLPAWTKIKFTYGHYLEAQAIEMAIMAGHEVTGEQDELVVDRVSGHRDCVIDGCLVDVKSANSRSFVKFKDKSIALDDRFGYLDQLDGYLAGCADDPLVRVKDRAYLLAIDQELGHMCLYEHYGRPDRIKQTIVEYKDIVGRISAPACTCETVADGESGNVKLGVKASYNSFKYCCFPKLRTFIYSEGPRYFTKVVKRPMNKYGPIKEVDRYGKVIYN